MPDNSGILRQYLVKLNFKLDEESRKKFLLALDNTAKAFATVAKASAATASGIAADVAVMASRFEKLYYASQRAHASAQNLKAFGNAAEQIGISAESAMNAVEGMQQALRLNPGLRGLLSQLGVDPNQRDGVKMLLDLVDRVSKMPFYQGARVASVFGIDDKMLLQLEQNSAALHRFYDEQQKLQAGMNQAAVSGTVFMQSLRGAAQAVEALSMKIASKSGLLENLTMVNEYWRQQATELSVLIDKYGVLTGAQMKVMEIGKELAGAAKNIPIGPGATIGSAIDEMKGFYQRHFGKGGGVTVTTPGNTGVSLHNPGNLRSWGNTPLASISGANGKFASFDDDFQGLSAMAGNIIRYAQRGINSVAGIVSQWAPAADNNDVQAYIADVAKKMGVGGSFGLDLTKPENIDKLMAAMINHEQGKQPFSMSMIDNAVRYRMAQPTFGSKAGVNINQKTEINVDGSGDPNSVGRAVAREQSRVNGDLVRNMSGAPQ